MLNAGEDEDPYSFYSSQYYDQKIDIKGVSAQFSHLLNDATRLDMVVGAQSSQRDIGGNGDGTPYPQYEYLFDEDLSQASVELRLRKRNSRAASTGWSAPST